MKIYVASSWRNEFYPEVVKTLRDMGHEVYDFRNPDPSEPSLKGQENRTGFKWEYVDPNYMDWTPEEYRERLNCNMAERQFKNDVEAMEGCDACVLVLPCGRSAHTEAGWFAGRGKKVIAYIPTKQEPELMYKLFDGIVCDLEEMDRFLHSSSI